MRALRPPEPLRTLEVIARETARVNRTADAVDVAVAAGACAGPMNAVQIVLHVALGLVDSRLPVWRWRERRAGLSAWYDAIGARTSFHSTVPPPL